MPQDAQNSRTCGVLLTSVEEIDLKQNTYVLRIAGKPKVE